MAIQITIDDCWNRRGPSNHCDQMQDYGHCRNCPTYAEAAQNIMRRQIPSNYRHDWAQHFAQVDEDNRAASESAVVFRIGHEWLALPTRIFVTVAENGTPHRLPHRNASGLLGVVNVSGRLYPCVALSELMTIDVQKTYLQSGRHTYPRLIVVKAGPQAVAFPVDDVHGIEHYRNEEMLAPPSTVSKGVARFLVGVLGFGGMQTGYIDTGLLGDSIAKIIR